MHKTVNPAAFASEIQPLIDQLAEPVRSGVGALIAKLTLHISEQAKHISEQERRIARKTRPHRRRWPRSGPVGGHSPGDSSPYVVDG